MNNILDVPPGILECTHKDLSPQVYIYGVDYDKWVKYHLFEYKQRVSKIKVDGQIWAIGDLFDHNGSVNCPITEFNWSKDTGWRIFCGMRDFSPAEIWKASSTKSIEQRVQDLENKFGALKMYIKNL